MPSLTGLRIATRGSKLARWQAEWVAARLATADVGVEMIEIATRGDVDQRDSLAGMGGIGVFTKEIQAAVLAGAADLAVHSLKDLPTAPMAGLTLAAVGPREDSADALVARVAASLDQLPAAARVGTGSPRRRAQLLHLRPDLEVVAIRGNVDTRLRKLDEGQYDALVLAAAGLARLGLSGRATERLAPPRMLPAPGQGALAIECRSNDAATVSILQNLDDGPTRLAVVAERAALAGLGGGCSAPIAAWGRVADGQLLLDALVAHMDGTTILRESAACELPLAAGADALRAAQSLGRRVAEQLLSRGAADLLAAARR